MERVIVPDELEEDTGVEQTLRPAWLADYIGQSKIKENIRIFISAAKMRQEPLEHVLLYGPPGLGKTTLAHVIAHEMGTHIRVTSGPAIERAGDLASILTNLSDGDILFIDEVHRLNRLIEEVLYPAMEDYHLDIIIGKGPSARTVTIDLPHFTLIGATTRASLISSPLRDRFGSVFHLDFYSHEEMNDIIQRSARILSLAIEDAATQEIAQRSRKTPRIANRLLRRVRDYCQVKGDGSIGHSMTKESLAHLDIDHLGLDSVDRKILQFIIEKYQGGPVGLGTIAAATSEEEATIEDVYEPFLIQIGFLHRTPRGRMATPAAYDHLGGEERKLL
ncbi:MAG: Holliday junction DNA helicase RuvB [Candidatus Jacksonbacteria bacterium RIFCSPLOWO2_02_FULL_43_9]|nr:MAG: Holliday junction ATP-dependent DNA helicase RuvB [Parcubacteria group bacterium GW2011_GWA2_43_13]OGY68782.1 MAG: Holliday junction DNA helicase RuvB [Candidatus Jacksonbacteria bacterium RIFCSPHIGHO2_02_FULL_43_10]OGY71146.1 MAG: Holliday junction DNA helicase RuvB [Candidatus Jacksonbacteria bacterium RIFCSPLOWO2_01_FULL_44_13]OGY72605.1 MAG: Holliday junction DNA helicase RuvB [Candidatus Jacksonbacteria bacterium RIFCSPLOWO2_02_FULL_43_9]HAZ16503.1 Holliday junction branch migratio